MWGYLRCIILLGASFIVAYLTAALVDATPQLLLEKMKPQLGEIHRSNQPLESCSDIADWTDQLGNSCGTYVKNNWCRSKRANVDGIDAETACCACGGGGKHDAFAGFKEDRIGWTVVSKSPEVICLNVSAYIRRLTLTPRFKNTTVTRITSGQESSVDYWRAENNGTSLRLNVVEYLKRRTRFQSFYLHFQEGHKPVKLEVRFDTVQYKLSFDEWGINLENLGDFLGAGATATIHKLTNSKYNVSAAMKHYKECNRDRFKKELDIMNDLRWYEPIVDLLGYYEEHHTKKKSVCLYVMELMDGNSEELRRLIHDEFRLGKFNGTKREFYSKVDYISSRATYDLFAGLSVLHGTAVYAHRDVKLKNLFYKKVDGKDGWDFQFKVGDFDATRPILLKSNGKYKGFHYLRRRRGWRAPEQLKTHRMNRHHLEYSANIDIYTGASVSLTLITDRFVWEIPGSNRSRIDEQYPRENEEYLQRMETFRDLQNCTDCFGDAIISPQAKDFFYSTLRWDPTKRLTTEEILEHPWVSRHRINSIF